MQRHQLSPFILVMFITGAIDSIRNLPSMALFGQHILLFYGIAVLGFLIPTALITAELSLQTPQRAGIFAWCNDHLNPKAGLMAIWLQWVNTLVWFPSILAFIANTAAYLIDPQLATHPGFTIGCMLGLYWLLTLINCFGVKVSAQFTSVCTVLGMLLPMTLLIGLGVVWWWQHPHLSSTPHHWLPAASWRQLPWSSLTAGITACLGMELIAVYTPQLKQPRKILPKTLICSTALITATTLLGVMAIALIIPSQKLSLIAGTLQTFKILLQQNHLSNALPVVIAAIALGTTGSMMNWMLSPAEGLQQASRDGLLPAWLNTINRFDAPTEFWCCKPF